MLLEALLAHFMVLSLDELNTTSKILWRAANRPAFIPVSEMLLRTYITLKTKQTYSTWQVILGPATG
jgi:hypothetical protein